MPSLSFIRKQCELVIEATVRAQGNGQTDGGPSQVVALLRSIKKIPPQNIYRGRIGRKARARQIKRIKERAEKMGLV